jgi:hypothetical protein
MPQGGERSGLRRELVEVRRKIRRQLEILKGQASSGDLWGDNREVIAKLERELRDINVALTLGTRQNP